MLTSVILNHMVHQVSIDATFGALADATRRGILEQLTRGEASISTLAARFEMTLTGVKKHVAVLEEAGLVTTQKQGRVRSCRLGPRRLDREAAWIDSYRRALEQRLDALGEYLARSAPTKDKPR